MQQICLDVTRGTFLWNNASQPTPPKFEDMFRVMAPIGQAPGALPYDAVNASDPAPAGAEVLTFSGASAAAARRIAPENAGHLMMQTATALERLANDYGICDPVHRLVLFLDTSDWVGNRRPKLCRKFTEDLASLCLLTRWSPCRSCKLGRR